MTDKEAEQLAIKLISRLLAKSKITQEGFDYALGERMTVKELFDYAILDCAELLRMGRKTESAALAAHICAVVTFVQSGHRKGTYNG